MIRKYISTGSFICAIIFPEFFGDATLHAQDQPGNSNTNNPNIILILADDLGYGDLGCYQPDSKIPTPNLDQLADEGMRFTNAYCPVSVCSPTRYSIMTGRYPWRSWKKLGVMRNYEPSMIENDRLTLPEMLQQAGYKTAGFGKWHLGTTFPTNDGQLPVGYGKFREDNNGANLDFSQPLTDGPIDHGFDHWLGFSCASECWVFKDDQVMGAILHDLYTIEAAPGADQLQHIPLADYLPFITDKSIDFIQQQSAANNDKPFFLYYSPYVPHIPLAVSPGFLGKTQAGAYGDYVHQLDHYIGKLLSELDRQGLTENTLVLFMSDNGSQFLYTSPEDDPSKVSNNPEDISADIPANAHRPNFPLRGTKWSVYEGGLRTPLIASWPGHFPKGSTANQLIALTDLFPTIAALVNQELPDNAAEDGQNLLSAFFGDNSNHHEEKAIVLQSSSNVFGLRWKNWKYIESKPGQSIELYDLSSDPGETLNLYADEPQIAQKMKNMLYEIRNNNP